MDNMSRCGCSLNITLISSENATIDKCFDVDAARIQFQSRLITMDHLLEVRNLQTHFPTRAGLVRAVDGVSFHLDRGELLGLVGESGCGKSITALSVMRLIAPPGRIVNGEIIFEEENLLNASEARMREIRGDD